MNMMLVLAIYVVAIVAYVAFSRRRQAKAQEDRFAGLAKGAEVETIGGLVAVVDEIDKENNRIVLDAEGVFLTFDLSRSIIESDYASTNYRDSRNKLKRQIIRRRFSN